MAAAIDYLHEKELGDPARRVALDRLHYEDDPLILFRGRQALSHLRVLQPALQELLFSKQHVWRYVLEEFAENCLNPRQSATDDFD